MRSWIAGLLAAGLLATGAMAAPVKATLNGGVMVGEGDGAVNVFKGVPFAQPPVGDLRWAPPQPIRWSGERPATQFALPCQQATTPGRSNGGGVSGQTQEDCLYLNVWAPANGRNAPVMVWLFGGGGTMGAGHLGAYDGTSFAKDGVIVVTINYRLGIFGNFAHPALTKAARPGEALANYALLDAIAALRWVQNNAGVFGGDRNNVTLFGQSAGGGMVAGLLSSPLARGLFHKAIIQSSGSSMGPGTPLAAAEAAGARAATALGLPGAEASLAQLRAVPADKIMSTQGVFGGTRGALDGRVKTVSTAEALRAGTAIDVPLMIGTNSNEDRLEGTNELVRLAASGAPAWRYFFDYVPDWRLPAQRLGAPHSAEIPYVFNSLGTSATGGGSQVTDKDRAVAARVHSCWVAFARAPPTAQSLTCADGFTWPAYTPKNDAVAIFQERASRGKQAELTSPPTWRVQAAASN